jgi:beta-mannosidase
MTLPQLLSLDGAWQLLPIDEFRQGFYPLDDEAWLEQELPAHWQQLPLLEHYAGKMVYRKRFQVTRNQFRMASDESDTRNSEPVTRFWLRLNGTFYWSQPYFNGVDLGRHEGYFAPQEHEVTRWVADENALVVEVECPEEHDKFGKRMITGVFSHWDCLDPATNPGGIWLPVELIATGPTRIKATLLHTEAFGADSAELRYRVSLNAAVAADATLRWTLAPKNFAGEVQVIEQRRALAAGAQDLAGVLQVRDPQPWWTHDLGHPNCYTVTLTVTQDGAASDERSFTFGIRHFELRDWIAHLNGRRLFLKGNNYPPTDTRLATVTPERCAEDLRLARECNMNLLRVHAHVAHPALYEAADQAGVLLWQDMPLQWLYRREVLPAASEQARAMVRQLYNHPAVAIWCMHNEPLYTADTKDDRLSTRGRIYFSVFVWNWNRSVMDKQLQQIAREEDPTRPAVRSSNEYAVPLVRKGTDTHFYFGWYGEIYGSLRGFEAVARRFPDNIRFVTEFGAQSFPNAESSAKFMSADVEKIDWEHLVARHHFQPKMLDMWTDWRSARSLEQLADISQNYQSQVNRFYIDRLRFHKYRPTGGVVPFMFMDSNPAIQWSVVDYWRVPKRSYAAMRLAFSPQYIFTLLDKDEYAAGAQIGVPIYVVNDQHRAVSCRLEASLRDPDGAEVAEVERAITLPPDCMAMEIDRLRLTPPRPGTYRLALALHPVQGQAVEHEYEIVVV